MRRVEPARVAPDSPPDGGRVSRITAPWRRLVAGSHGQSDSQQRTLGEMLMRKRNGWIWWAATLPAVLLAVAGHAGAETYTTDSGVLCGDREPMLAEIERHLGDNAISRGFTEQGTVIEILTGVDGGWSMIETSLSGITCIVASGDFWQYPVGQEPPLEKSL